VVLVQPFDCTHGLRPARPQVFVYNQGVKDKKLFIGYIKPEKVERINFIIREANSRDIPQVIKLCLDTFREVNFIENGKWYDIRKMENLVAVRDDKVLGFASWKKEKDRLFLLVILTDPEYYRQGIGTTLLNKIKEIAKRLNFKKIFVPISNDDLVSYVFYHKNGFRLVGIDIGLPKKRHGKEVAGFWRLPCRDEFYLEHKTTK